MAVDEAKLETTIKNLGAKIAEKNEEAAEMRQTYKNLTEIQMQPGEAQPGDTDPPAKVIPINVRSHKPYTAAQRLTQYNDNIPKAEAFLA